MLRHITLTLAFIVSAAAGAMADDSVFNIGGDTFIGGQQARISTPVDGDVFAAGFDIAINADVAGDAHAAGYSIAIPSNVAGDVYAMGNSINISGKVGQDLSATGASINVSGAGVDGNVRLAGANINLGAPVTGAAIIGGASVTIDGPITGDAQIAAESVTFTNRAKIGGSVHITSSNEISVPESVAPAARVTFEKVEPGDLPTGPEGITEHSMRSFWPGWLPGMAAIVVFAIIGLAWLGLMPKRSWRAYLTGMAKPVKSLFFGILALAAFIGLIPAVAITIIGIPLVPIAVILLVLAVILGYTAGAFAIAARIMQGFGFETDTMARRAIALLVGLVAAWVVTLIPFVGWPLQLALTFFGLGFITLSAMARWIDADFHDRLAAQAG
jgi:hypothetical protein